MSLEQFLREITADSQDVLGLLDDHQGTQIEILSKQIDKLCKFIDSLPKLEKMDGFDLWQNTIMKNKSKPI